MPKIIEFPDLNQTVEVPDDITDAGIDDVYKTLAKQQFRAKQGQLRAEAMEAQTKADVLDAYENDPEMPLLMRSELGRRVASGMANMAGSAVSAGSMLLPGEVSKGVNAYGKELSRMGDIASTAPGSLSEIESVGDVAGYAGRMLAEQIPQLLVSGPVAGGLKAAGLSAKAAAVLAPVITTFPQEAGAIYQDITDQTGETGFRQRAVATAGGLASAGLEAVGGDARVLRNLANEGEDVISRSLFKNLGRGFVKGARDEGLTEAGQEAVASLAPGFAGGDFPTQNQFLRRVGEAAVGGALSGGAMGAVSKQVGDSAYIAALADTASTEVNQGGTYVMRDRDGNVMRDKQGRVMTEVRGGINSDEGLQPYRGARIEEGRPAEFRANPNDLSSLTAADEIATARANAAAQRRDEQVVAGRTADQAREAEAQRLRAEEEALAQRGLDEDQLAGQMATGRQSSSDQRLSALTAEGAAMRQQREAQAAAEERRLEQEAMRARRREQRDAVADGLTSESGQTYDITTPPEPQAPPAPARSTLDTESGLRQSRVARTDVTSPVDAYMMGRAPRRLNLPQPIADLYDGVRSIVSAVNDNQEVDPQIASDLAVEAPSIAKQLKVRIENAIASGVVESDINPLIDLATQLDAYPANYKAYTELTQEMMTKARRTSERRRGITPTKPQKISPPTVISLPVGTGVASGGGALAAAPDQSSTTEAKGVAPKPFESIAFRGVGAEAALPQDGRTFWSPSREGAAEYGPNITQETIRFENPLYAKNWIDAKRALGVPASTTMPKLLEAAEIAGHDGIVWSHHGKPEFVKLSTRGSQNLSNVSQDQAPVTTPASTPQPTQAQATGGTGNKKATQVQGVANANPLQSPVEVSGGNQPQGAAQDAGGQAGAVQVAAGTQLQDQQPTPPKREDGTPVAVGDFVSVRGIPKTGNVELIGTVDRIEGGKAFVTITNVGRGGENTATRNGFAPKQTIAVTADQRISKTAPIEEKVPQKRGRKSSMSDEFRAELQARIDAASQTEDYLEYRELRDLAEKGDDEAAAKLDQFIEARADNPLLRDIQAAYEFNRKSDVVERASRRLRVQNEKTVLDEYDRVIHSWLVDPKKPSRFSRKVALESALLKEFTSRPEIRDERSKKRRDDARKKQKSAISEATDSVLGEDGGAKSTYSNRNIATGEDVDTDNPADAEARREASAARNSAPDAIQNAVIDAFKANGQKMPTKPKLSMVIASALSKHAAIDPKDAEAVSAAKQYSRSLADLVAALFKQGVPLTQIGKRLNRMFANKNYFGTSGRSLSLGEFTLKDAIDSIIDMTDADGVLVTMAKKLLKAGVDAKVVVLSDADFDQLGVPAGEVAFYDSNPSGNTIFIRQSASAHDYLVMHEAIHAATVHALRTNVQFRNEIGRLRAMAIEALGTGYYGLQDHGNNFTNLAEFIAEGFTNAEFRSQLENIPVKGKGIWSTIKGMLGNIFGFDTEQQSILDALLNSTPDQFAPNVASSPSAQDAAYMDLVARYEAGDESVLPELQRMVDEAAKAAGYNIGPVWHGTTESFDVFDDLEAPDGFHFGTKASADSFGPSKPYYLRGSIKDVKDMGRSWSMDLPGNNEVYRYINNYEDVGSTSYVVANPENVKLATPITRDSNGNVIPLSQRFNPESDSVLFAAKPYTTAQEVVDALKIPDADGQQAITLSARSTQQLVQRGVVQGIEDSFLPRNHRDLLEEIKAETDKKARAQLIKSAKDQGFDYGKYVISPERRAENNVRSILGLAELTDGDGIKIGDISDPRMVREASFVVDRTAMRIEEMQRRNQTKKEALQKAATDPMDPLNKALEDLKSVEGMVASTANEAIADYRDYLMNLRTESKLSGASVNEQVVDIANRAKRLGRQTSQIGDAIVDIASNLTKEEIENAKTNQDLVDLIRSKGILDGSPIQNLLTPADGTPGLLQKYVGLKASLLHIQELKADEAKVAADITAAQKAFAAAVGRKNAGPISLGDFARAYAKLVTHLGQIAEVNRKIARRTKDIRVAELVENALKQITSSPEYVEQRNAAVRALDKRIYGINGRDEGNYHIIELGQDPNDPNKLEEFRFLNTVNNPEDAKRNAETYAKLLSKIDGMLEDPATSPELHHTLLVKKLELQSEMDDRIEGAMGMSMIDPIGYFRRLPWVRNFITPNLPAWLMNGRLGKRIRSLNDAIDRMYVQIKDLRGNVHYGRRAIILASKAALDSHIADMPPGLSKEKQEEWWVKNVLEQVLSQNQNIKEDSLKAGDYTRNNVRVTREDVKAAELMAKWNDQLRKIIESMSGIAQFFPTRILEKVNGVMYSRLAYATSSLTVPRLLNRLTTPSGTSSSPMDIVNRWSQLKTKEEKAAFLADYDAFDTLALAHVGELNSEYQRRSENEQVYRKLAREWRKNGNAPTSINELVEQIDRELAPEGDLDEDAEIFDEDSDKPTTLDKLIAEIDGYTNKLLTQAKETAKENAARLSSQVGTAKRSELNVLIELDGENAFTKPRLEMVAPSSFYRYELATGQSFGALQRGALLPIQLQQLDLISEYRNKLEAAIIELAQERDSSLWGDFTKEMVRSANGDIYMTRREMQRMLKQITIVESSLEDALNVSSASSEDTGLLSKMLDVVKSQMLSAITSLTRNVVTGVAFSRAAADMVVRGHKIVAPVRITGHVLGTLRDIALTVLGKNEGIANFIKSADKGPLRTVFQNLANSMQQIESARNHLGSDGYTLKQDMAFRALGDRTFSRNKFGQGKGDQFVEAFLSAPGIRHAMSMMNKIVERQERLTNILSIKYFDEALRSNFYNLSKIIEQRIANGRAGTLDFSKPENRFTAKELESVGINPNTWARQLRLFNTTMTMEQMVMDYYNRLQTAKAEGKNWTTVPFTENDGVYGDMIDALGKLNNQPALSNRPAIVRGRTQLGDIAREAVLFPGFANGYLSTLQLMQMVAKNQGIPQRMHYSVSQLLILFLSLLGIGIPTAEISKWVYRAYYGRPYPAETFSDLFNSDITPARAARITGAALATTIPYLGEYIASAMGAQNYKAAVTDLANMSLPLKLATTSYDAAKTLLQTGDATGAALSVGRGFAPSLTPLINRLPAIQARNAAADAVRVAKVSRGELEVPNRAGGGYGGQQTEFGSTINKALAASAAGDMGTAKQLIQKATKMKADAGDKNPESAVRNAIQSRRPEYKAFGRKLSEDEKTGLLGRMSDGQRATYQKADDAASRLLEMAPTKTQVSKGKAGPIDRINKRFASIRKASKPKALVALNKKIRSIKPKKLKKLKIGKASPASGSRLLRPKARAKAASALLPSAL